MRAAPRSSALHRARAAPARSRSRPRCHGRAPEGLAHAWSEGSPIRKRKTLTISVKEISLHPDGCTACNVRTARRDAQQQRRCGVLNSTRSQGRIKHEDRICTWPRLTGATPGDADGPIRRVRGHRDGLHQTRSPRARRRACDGSLVAEAVLEFGDDLRQASETVAKWRGGGGE